MAGTKLWPEDPKPESRWAESEGGVIGKGAARPLLTS